MYDNGWQMKGRDGNEIRARTFRVTAFLLSHSFTSVYTLKVVDRPPSLRGGSQGRKALVTANWQTDPDVRREESAEGANEVNARKGTTCYILKYMYFYMCATLVTLQRRWNQEYVYPYVVSLVAERSGLWQTAADVFVVEIIKQVHDGLLGSKGTRNINAHYCLELYYHL